MDDLLSKLGLAHRPQPTEIAPELRSEREIVDIGTVSKQSLNKTELRVFTEKPPSDLQSDPGIKFGSGSSGLAFEGSLNVTQAFTEISPSELQLEKEIGSGGFGRVFKGSWNKTEVAIKVFKLEGGIRPRQAAIQKEAGTWANLRHPHVLQFLGADTKGDTPFIVMPYLVNGNARDFIQRHAECNRNKILHDVSLALVYLHGRNVVHGDIKGFNVLIDSGKNAVLCDFGIALIKEDVMSTSLNPRETSIAGTRSFMAPERLKGGSLRKPCDVYAFGMLIYEVHADAHPLNLHVGYSEFMKLVAEEGHRPERPDREAAPQLTDDVWGLAKRCWEGNTSARPTIDHVCDTIAPSAKLYDNSPPNAVPNTVPNTVPNAVPITIPKAHVLKPLPSAYDRLQAGATFRESLAIRTPCIGLSAIAMTHDGKTIASSGPREGSKDEGSIQKWDSTSGARRRSLRGHTDWVTYLSFFENGSLVSGSLDCTVRIWKLASSAPVILKHDSAIACISLSADNKTIATGVDDGRGSVRLWDATTGYVMHTIEDPQCSVIDSISISSDTSSLVTFGYDVRRQWVAARWKQQPDRQWIIDARRECTVENFQECFTSCSSSGLRFALSKEDHVVIYGLHENETRVDEGGGVVRFSPDGNWIVGRVAYKTVKIWDAASGKLLSELLSSRKIVTTLFISHDDSTILAGDEEILRVLVLTDR